MKRRTAITSAVLILLFFAAMGGLIAKRAQLCTSRVPSAAVTARIEPASAQSVKKTSKLRALYDRYRHVERVQLRDGTVLFGVMHESEGSADLLTPDGKLSIPRDEIVRVEYMNPDRI